MNLGICARRGSTGECRLSQRCGHACDTTAYIFPASCSPLSQSSSRGASPPSPSSASHASASPVHLATKPAVRCLNLHLNTHAATGSLARTCKGVQSFLGQDWRLEHQLTDAELTGERQVSQVSMTAADLLQPVQKRQDL